MLSSVFALLSSSLAVPTAASSLLLGCWNITVDLPFPLPNRDARACFSKSSSGALKGQVHIDGAWRPMASVSSSAPNFAFRVRKDGKDLRFKGKVAADGKTMAGTVQRGDRTLPFDGEK
ncbi:MAG: hypothetical protein AAGA56_03710 [Myxococcota bacterium]